MIKNFVYIDEYKMYSLSSQIFEGVTEYLINEDHKAEEDQESQKGPLSSGRVLASIMKNESKVTQGKSLNDYSYTLFEKQLFSMDKVLEIDIDNIEESISKIDDYSFVKIKGKAIFHDVEKIIETLKTFNDFGEAITYVTNSESINKLKAEAILLKAGENNKGKRSKIDAELKKITNIKALAKEAGLQLDDEFTKNLSYLLSYGYFDQIDMQIDVNGRLFSAPLDRACLRDDINLLIKKYARHTEKEFVIFGVVTQHNGTNELDLDGEQDNSSIKTALSSMVNHITNLETQYTGRLDNETVIEPIAVYTEL